MGNDRQLVANELTEEEQQALIQQAFDLERKIVSSVTKLTQDAWELAALLYEFQEMRGWTLLGHETIYDWLGQPEVGLKRTEFESKVRMFRDLVIVKQVPAESLSGVEPSKALEILPAVMKGDVEVDDALDAAKTLSKSDLRERFSTPRINDHGQAADGSTPLAPERETLAKCPMCESMVPESKLPPRA
jgi:hypothetical protein